MATFVLVHGGWGGGWEWRLVADGLRDAGHEAYRVTLTGMGERRHLARPEVDLATHIQDVVAVIEEEELRDVVLLGQSYGGAVVTGVADRVPDRIRRLVYVDGFVPRDGEAVVDLVPAELAEGLRATARETGHGWETQVPFAGEWDGDVPVERKEWYRRHLSGQPLATFERPIHLTGAGEALPRTYIATGPADDPGSLFDVFFERARAAGWDVHELRVGHDAHVIAPDRLVRLLDVAAALETRTLEPVSGA